MNTTGSCGSLEPCWWVVDIGVRARVVDTSASPIPRPGTSEFRASEYGSRAPLHVRIDAGLLNGRVGSSRSWLIDATSTRAYLFASSVPLHLVGPGSLAEYTKAGELSSTDRRNLFMQVLAGLWPCDTRHQEGIPGAPGLGCNCSIRVRVPAGRTELAMPIPAGARTLAIYDASASSSPWTWQLGEDVGERSGRIAVFDGQTVSAALVPNFSHVAPAAAHAVERDVLLVFGVDL